jgi:uncharacterized protein CbrC (UPF0167 family)
MPSEIRTRVATNEYRKGWDDVCWKHNFVTTTMRNPICNTYIRKCLKCGATIEIARDEIENG